MRGCENDDDDDHDNNNHNNVDDVHAKCNIQLNV
jgi:hypothetical protein